MQTKIDKKSRKIDVFYVLRAKSPKNNGKIPQGLKAVSRKGGALGGLCVINLFIYITSALLPLTFPDFLKTN